MNKMFHSMVAWLADPFGRKARLQRNGQIISTVVTTDVFVRTKIEEYRTREAVNAVERAVLGNQHLSRG